VKGGTVLKEQLRFDDVNVGQEIPSYTTTVSTARSAVWAAANRDFSAYHFDHDCARERRLPQAIVNGRFKIVILIKLLTDWIGPEGWLCRIAAQHRGMDLTGNAMVVKGIVKDKIEKQGQKLVECDVWIEDPEGNKTSPGNATVALP